MRKIIFICFLTSICFLNNTDLSAQTLAESEVSEAFKKYFDARKLQDWDTVANIHPFSPEVTNFVYKSLIKHTG